MRGIVFEMKGKKIGVVIRNSPDADLRAVEAMRMGVGLTLRDIEVYLFFLEDGLKALREKPVKRGDEPVYQKHLETLVELKQNLVVENESMEECECLCKTWNPMIWSRDAIFQFLTRCDGVVFV